MLSDLDPIIDLLHDLLVGLDEGGSGSGNFGHAGVPGQQGGSAGRGGSLYQKDTLTGKDLPAPSPEDVISVQSAIGKVNSVVGGDFGMDTPINIGPIKGFKTAPLGHFGKTINGDPILEVDPERVLESVNKGNWSDEDFKDWYQVSERSEEALLEHVVAHELGYRLWASMSVKSQDLMPLPGGGRARIETTPSLIKWRDDLWRTHRDSMSGYSRYQGSYTEAFSDSFAAYVTGENLDPAVENWFTENLK